MIPIHKPGKAKTDATSYRPISLTKCMVKLLERIINTRLKWFLETEKLLVPQQAGFREHQLPTLVKSAMYADDLVMWNMLRLLKYGFKQQSTYFLIGQMSGA